MDDLDYTWQPGNGSEAQNIIRAAEAPPDSPFRPHSRRRASHGEGGVIAPPSNGAALALGLARGGPGTTRVTAACIAGGVGSSSAMLSALGVLLSKQQVAEAMVECLTLRDVFKLGSTCRELMNRLLICGGPNGSAASGVGAGAAVGGGIAGQSQETRPPLLVHIRGAKEFLAYFRALEQPQAAWTQRRMMAVSIVLDYHDSIDGPIPSFLGGGAGINTVEWLDLGRSNLTGNIPESLGTLPNLRKLYLAGNKLVGNIPSSLGNILTLTDLSLAGNELSGPIPDSFGNLTLLRYLSLRDNKLSGPIPASLGNLVNLEELWLNANQISGEIPASLGNMVTARKIFLNNNRISGSLPSTLGNLSRLRILSLRHNNLVGTVPPDLGRLSQLKTLYMEKNQLEGNIPETLANLDALEELNLLGNKFQGIAETRNLLIGRLPNCVVYV